MNVPRRLLVAEDNLALAGVVAFNLRQAGFDVVVRHNGADAWREVQSEDFDLIVLDEQMPGMNGSELCARLRSHPQKKDIPVVMVTAKRLELDLARLQDELKASAVFPKPFSPTDLVAQVKHSLAGTASKD